MDLAMVYPFLYSLPWVLVWIIELNFCNLSFWDSIDMMNFIGYIEPSIRENYLADFGIVIISKMMLIS